MYSFSYNDLENMSSMYIEDITKNSNYTYNNIKVPRVTEVLHKMIEEESIILWANKLGLQNKDYLETLNIYADIGTKTHEAINNFFNNDTINVNTPYYPFNSFLKYINETNKSNHKIKYHSSEVPLSNKYFGGTYDALLYIDDQLTLVDFKTSSVVGYKFFIQLGAYAILLKEIKNIDLDKVMILQLNRKQVCYNTYTLDLHNSFDKSTFESCQKTFLSLLYSYYQINYIEGVFKYEYNIH